jgi:ubiquinone biosynthesis protein UbiJ
MTPPSRTCARAIRDGGIDAMAALDSALSAALDGLSPDQARELKRMFGHLMGEIVDQLINPAVRAFPDLKADQPTWASIARERAALRAGTST